MVVGWLRTIALTYYPSGFADLPLIAAWIFYQKSKFLQFVPPQVYQAAGDTLGGPGPGITSEQYGAAERCYEPDLPKSRGDFALTYFARDSKLFLFGGMRTE